MYKKITIDSLNKKLLVDSKWHEQCFKCYKSIDINSHICFYDASNDHWLCENCYKVIYKNFKYAMRGQGKYIVLVKDNCDELFKQVKKIVLNNYAFSKEEDRSCYAFRLASIYNNDKYFIDIIIDKLKRTKLEDDYTFIYLLDVLALFLFKNKLNVYKEILIKIFNMKTRKNDFSINESASASKILSVILEVYNDRTFIEEFISNYYSSHNESNLDLFIVGYTYKIKISKIYKENEKNNLPLDDVNNYLKLLSNLEDEKWCKLYLLVASIYIYSNTFNALLDDLIMKKWDKELSKKILKILVNSDLLTIKACQQLLKTIDFYDEEYNTILLQRMCAIKSKKIKCYAYNLLSIDKYTPYCVINILNNYDNKDYKIVHKYIRNMNINYSDNSYWFEVESSLIDYFKRKNVDKRLLKDVYYFMNNGLSSDSRYYLVKILIKYNYLKDFDYRWLKYDANPKTNKLVQKYNTFIITN